MVIFGLLRPKKGSKNYFFKFSYTTFLNNHPKMVSIKNQPIWTKIEDLHTFFVIFFMKNGEIAPRISVFGLKMANFQNSSKSFEIWLDIMEIQYWSKFLVIWVFFEGFIVILVTHFSLFFIYSFLGLKSKKKSFFVIF